MFVILRQAVVGLVLIYLFGHEQIKLALLVWALAVFGLVLFGSLKTKWVGLPGKNSRTGRIDILKGLLFMPYYAVVILLMIGGKLISFGKKWKSCTELAGGIYVGDYYSSFMSEISWQGVVDLTNELPRFTKSKSYINIQSWDGCPPSIENIQKAVEFVRKCKRPVLIHCAYVPFLRCIMFIPIVMAKVAAQRSHVQRSLLAELFPVLTRPSCWYVAFSFV